MTMIDTIDVRPSDTAVRFPGTLPRLIPNRPVTGIEAHLGWYGPAPRSGAGLIAEVERAGLRGRGGAGFPTAVKMAAVARGRGGLVVANGTEGEPASDKDKTLMALAPHLVLDGAVAAGRAVGADRAIVCVERSAKAAIRAMRTALAERGTAGRDAIELSLALTPNRYVAGEASALVHWLNGGDARPTFSPHRQAERGVRGRPTLVDNVETLAHLALIARYGAEWWRTAGTADDPGSALVTISGAVARPGVYEIPLGVRLADVLAAAGGSPVAVQAVLVGGYFGSWLPAAAIDEARLESASLREWGASFGCGALVVLPESACGLAESARVTAWLAGQNAGQCGPCVFGLPAIAGAMDAMVRGDTHGVAQREAGRWTELVRGRGACKHPDGTAQFVESSLQTFADEIEVHRRRGPCPAAALLPVPTPGAWR
jgi:NADH:ubiquinone oxidoreductase subunit F (NADH-binding)